MHGCQPLVRSDFEWIVQELRDLPNQSRIFADVADDPTYVRSYLEQMYDAGQLFGWTRPSEGSFILGTAFKPWYANRLEVHEMILWVPSRFRGRMNALRLIQAFTIDALDKEPHSIHVGASLDITNADTTLALYERCGYRRDGPIGAVFRR